MQLSMQQALQSIGGPTCLLQYNLNSSFFYEMHSSKNTITVLKEKEEERASRCVCVGGCVCACACAYVCVNRGGESISYAQAFVSLRGGIFSKQDLASEEELKWVVRQLTWSMYVYARPRAYLPMHAQIPRVPRIKPTNNAT